jgi:hypothetical protein
MLLQQGLLLPLVLLSVAWCSFCCSRSVLLCFAVLHNHCCACLALML